MNEATTKGSHSRKKKYTARATIVAVDVSVSVALAVAVAVSIALCMCAYLECNFTAASLARCLSRLECTLPRKLCVKSNVNKKAKVPKELQPAGDERQSRLLG